MGIGMALNFEENSIFVATLLALTGGSFLYVGAVEVVLGELEKVRVSYMPILPVMTFFLLWFALMTLLAKWF